ncbi:MAG: Holliday junction branch migration protein RuvA [Clostridiales bacterium]|nr:Holliday junction branch migration protein RuvA [Clostridiales bacterium]
MIYNLKGTLTVSDINYIVVECSGVGFKCYISFNTAKELGKTGDEVNVYTYLAIKDDAMDLYGFATLTELDSFKLLISVSGVGPKAAIAILSELSPDRLAICIASGDAKAITKAQGVGKKIAERIVLELKDKMSKIASDEASISVENAVNASDSGTFSEAVAALVSLGFSQSDASVVVGVMDKSLSVDEMIRQGLKKLSKNL